MNRHQMGLVNAHIGKKIRIARSDQGLSLKAFADLVGISYQQVQKYEKGKAKVNCSTLMKVSEVLNVPIKRFLAELETNKLPAKSNGNVVSSDMFELVDLYGSLHPEMRTSFANAVESIAQQPNPDC